MKLSKLIKKYMVESGRDDFTTYLAELLGISKQWASAKLSCKTDFTVPELSKLIGVFNFDAEELKTALERE